MVAGVSHFASGEKQQDVAQDTHDSQWDQGDAQALGEASSTHGSLSGTLTHTHVENISEIKSPSKSLYTCLAASWAPDSIPQTGTGSLYKTPPVMSLTLASLFFTAVFLWQPPSSDWLMFYQGICLAAWPQPWAVRGIDRSCRAGLGASRCTSRLSVEPFCLGLVFTSNRGLSLSCRSCLIPVWHTLIKKSDKRNWICWLWGIFNWVTPKLLRVCHMESSMPITVSYIYTDLSHSLAFVFCNVD